ncbi:MAG: hypothetical protein Q7J01_00430 [Syntrophales bacterium]|nr:hypothetical protein [Syntrophales bacterium]
MSVKYWEYFLSLEDDLERCTKYVEFSPKNYAAYSNEFAKIIMSASSEFENVAKDLCHLISPGSNPLNIENIYPILLGAYPKFGTVEVAILRYKITFKPWEDWTPTKRPDWWSKGYNKIKHSRTQSFEMANLNNAILSMAGLFVAILYYHHRASGGINIDFNRSPTLFDIVDTGLLSGASFTVSYDIPV